MHIHESISCGQGTHQFDPLLDAAHIGPGRRRGRVEVLGVGLDVDEAIGIAQRPGNQVARALDRQRQAARLEAHAQGRQQGPLYMCINAYT